MDDSEKAIGTLMEMGFSRSQVEKALSATQGGGIESAMEWLLSNGNDENNGGAEAEMAVDESPDANENVVENAQAEAPEAEVPEAEPSASNEAKSIVCDECGKKFKSPVEVEFHAVKSGHQSFSESTDEVKPLTEEEKAEQKRKLEDKIKQRRKEKEEKERQESIEREKLRRKAGQEMIISKQKSQDMEMKRIAEEKRREKAEERLARQRVKDQIEKDKLARKEKFGMHTPNSSSTSSVEPPKPVQVAAPKKDYDQCRLQIRLTNGQALSQSFGSKEQLAAVRLFVEMNRSDGTDPFQLMTNFPKKVFSSEDMSKPLSELGLVPSAVLIVTKSQV